MSKNVDIEVFPIARTVVDREAVRKWLDYLEVNKDWEFPNEQIVSDPALNIALSGKRCYMSYQEGLNKNVTKIRKDYGEYFDNILNSGHGSVLECAVYSFAIEGVSRVFCYDKDTEILTKDGWKNISIIKDDEILLTKNPLTGNARWSKNKKLHSFEYSDVMYYWENSEEISPMVTPDHTMWTTDMWKRRCRNLSAEEATNKYASKIPMKDLLGKIFTVDHRIGDIEGNWFEDKIKIGDYEYDSLLFAEWLGFVATDGTISNNSSGRNRIVVNQTKEKTSIRINELMNLLFNDRWKFYDYGGYKTFAISDKDLRNWTIENIGRLKKNRRFNKLFNWSNKLIEKLIIGIQGGDGFINGGDNQYLSCNNSITSSDYQVLYAKINRASRVYEEDKVGESHTTKNGLVFVATIPTVRLSINKKGVSQCQPYMQRVLHYNGLVYCPETEDGIVYVRNPKGRGLWACNTSEMNRHRAGWAISEGSLRFIRFDKFIPWWRPPSITPAIDDNEDLRNRKAKSFEIFQRAFQHQTECYKELLDIWDMDDAHHNFHYKKVVTSCLRRIIGMGVATGGVWTGNIRALRHVITMRTSPQAEEEICYVFSKIAKYLKEEEPLLFGDFYQDEQGFWRPKYVKV